MPDALFVTTRTSEPIENVRAWAHTMGQAKHLTFDINGPNEDDLILAGARSCGAEVIFYTGGVSGVGLPTEETLKALRRIAPTIMLQGDMADPPFHPILERYRSLDLFDLYVSMDGSRNEFVDHATLTPFDPQRFSTPSRRRTIHCGFAGNVVGRERYELLKREHGTEDPRSAVLHRLNGLVQLRERETDGSYENYLAFFRRTKLIINTSYAGSGLVHHVKGRVLEAAFSGCALLEMRASPLKDWFPPESYFTYADAEEASEAIQLLSDGEIKQTAALFQAYARANYTADKIYRGIMEKLNS